MLSVSDILRYQIRFSTWANGRILKAAATLSSEELEHDFGTSDKSIRGTLLHIYRSERIWLARIEGRPANFVLDGEDGLPYLLASWPALRDAWQLWSAPLTDADCNRNLSYQDLRNNPRTNSFSEIVLHVVNHSSHHRGQVSGFLRCLGKTPPNVDSISFARGVEC